MSRIIYSDILFVQPNWESSHIFIYYIAFKNISQITHITYLISSLFSSIERHKRASYITFYFIFFRNQTWGVIFSKVLFDGIQIVEPYLFHIYKSILGAFSHILFGEWFSLFLCLETYCLPWRGGRGTSCSQTSRWNILISDIRIFDIRIFWYWISGYPTFGCQIIWYRIK